MLGRQAVLGRVAESGGSTPLLPVTPRPARKTGTFRSHAPARRAAVRCQAVMTPERPTKPEPQTNNLGASIKPVYYSMDETTKTTRPRLVVLGSGWGAMSFIKSLPKNVSQLYDLILVSPRNYFLYTPLLPAVATGTCEERSIVEPVRKIMIGKGEFYEAVCKDIDPQAKELVCCFPQDTGMPEACFKVSYDLLVVSVGSVNNTFGIKGVETYANYFKSIEDANSLRRRVSECFERAALPATDEETRKKLLSFVVVGGGPTGVEVAAELHDMITDDLVRLYPRLIPDVKIQIVELMDHVLSTYDRKISDFTATEFKRTGISLVLNSRVAAVEDGIVRVVNKSNVSSNIPFGVCVWSTGIAMNPLVKTMQERLPGQGHFRSILTDDYLRVKGSDGSIYALGDAATIDQPKALDFAEKLFESADTDKRGVLTLEQLRGVMSSAAKYFSHLEEYARFLDSKAGVKRWGSMVRNIVGPQKSSSNPLAELDEKTGITKDQFKEIMGKIDKGLRALPATAQVAKQQGEYLAMLLTHDKKAGQVVPDPVESAPTFGKMFKYSHKGSAAYVGSDKAVFDVPKIGPLTGYGAGLAWKSFETYSQISFRNQCLVATDWLRTKVFGRDISRV